MIYFFQGTKELYIKGGGIMRKYILAGLAVIFVTFASSLVFAEGWISTDVEISEKLNVGISSSAVLPAKAQFFDTGISVDGIVTYDVLPYVAVGVEIGYAQIDAKWEGRSLGTMHAMPLMGDIVLKYPMEVENYIFVPYIVNGFGAYFSRIDEDNNIQPGVNISTNTPFTYKLGAGFDLYLIDVLALNFEASYRWTRIKYKASFEGETAAFPYDANADALYIGGGLKLKY